MPSSGGGPAFDYGFEPPPDNQLQGIIGRAGQTSQQVGDALMVIVEKCKAKGLATASELSACVQAEVNRLKQAGSETLSRVTMGAETALTGHLASAGERIASLQQSAGIPSTLEYPPASTGGPKGTSADIDIAAQKRQGMQQKGQGQQKQGQGQQQKGGQGQGQQQGNRQIVINQGGPVIIQQPGMPPQEEGYFLPFPEGFPVGGMPGFPVGAGGATVPPIPAPGTPGGPGSVSPFPVQPGTPGGPSGAGPVPPGSPYPGPGGSPSPGTGPTHEGLDSALMERLIELLAHPAQSTVPFPGGGQDNGTSPVLPPGGGPGGQGQQLNQEQINKLLQLVKQLINIIQQSPKEGNNYVVDASSVLDLSMDVEEIAGSPGPGQSNPPSGGGNSESSVVDAIRSVAKAVSGGTYDQWFDVARGKLEDDRDKITQYFGESFAGIYTARTREESVLAMSDIVFPADLDAQLDEYFPNGIS